MTGFQLFFYVSTDGHNKDATDPDRPFLIG